MPPRRTSRRQFLKGIAAREAIADLAAGIPTGAPAQHSPGQASPGQNAAGQAPPRRTAPPGCLLQVERSAMACRFAVYLPAQADDVSPDVALRALDQVDALEDQLSVYRDYSEVSQLNRRAHGEAVPVEAGLWDLLELSVRLYRQTGGAFDITAGPLTKVWGFYRRQGQLPTDDALQTALRAVGSDALQLDSAAFTVRFARPGLEINLGGIGKGYALDRAADVLSAEGVQHFLLHGGQSSVLARGDQQGAPSGPSAEPSPEEGASGGWIVGIKHPLRPERRQAELRLRNRALGTSSTETQHFFHRGRRYGHILDPRTGQPATGVLSATVLAPTAAEADALATAFFVLGVEEAHAYCQRHPQIAALLLTPGGRRGSIAVHPIGLTGDDWQRCE